MSDATPTLTVLLIEDNDAVRRVERLLLERAGHDVIAAAGGLEALEVFRRGDAQVDCVVLDQEMPGLDGEATARALRELDPTLPIVLTSGHCCPELEGRFADLGVRSILTKPCDAERLVSTVVREVDARRALR